MDELIKIYKQSDGSETVSARDLWLYLDCKSDFSDWITRRILKGGFQNSVDFVKVKDKKDGNLNGKIEYFLSVDMAKELAMMEGSEKGKKARSYFILCEKKLFSLGYSIDERKSNEMLAFNTDDYSLIDGIRIKKSEKVRQPRLHQTNIISMPLHGAKARFFKSLKYIINKGFLESEKDFVQKYNILPGVFKGFKNSKSETVPLSYLYILVKYYKISSFWLITGEHRIGDPGVAIFDNFSVRDKSTNSLNLSRKWKS